MARKRPRVVAYPNDDQRPGFAAVAQNHWKTANELLDQAHADVDSVKFPHSLKGMSVICLYHATIECFLNEQLAFNTLRVDGEEDAQHAERVRVVRDLQDRLGTEKIDEILKTFGYLDKFDRGILADFARLNELRRLAYHHSPEFRPINEYPPVIVTMIERLDLKHVNTNWANWLGHLAVLKWCKEHVTAFINEFDRCADRSELTLQSPGYLTCEEFAKWAAKMKDRKEKLRTLGSHESDR